MTTPSPRHDQADSIADDYAERVLRNEGRLSGLELLVAETRESDQRLTEQRSESLARELERRAEALLELVTARADAVLSLSQEERESDRREWRLLNSESEKRGEVSLTSFREVYDTAISENYKQSREAIAALEQRRVAHVEKIEQMVRQWRDSDREARELFAAELKSHLDVLNHNNERMTLFQANSVTRELWQSEKEAATGREGLLRDQIIALDRTMLTLTPIAQSDKAHADIATRMETSIVASAQILDNKIDVVSEKVALLNKYRDTTQGRSAGYSSFYAWGATAVAIMVSVVVIANSLAGRS